MVCLKCDVCNVVCQCQLFCIAWMCCLEEVQKWSVCEVLAHYVVSAVVAVTVMRVLLFVLDVCMLRECEGERLTAILVRCGCC